MIKEIVNKILAEKLVIQTEVAKIVSVDGYAMTCEVSIVGKPNLTDVRLKSVIDKVDKGILITPAVGSYVLMSIINNKKGNAFVSGFSEVKSVRLITPEIELAGKDFRGLVKIEELKSELNKMSARVDVLFNAIKNGVPLSGSSDGGVGYQTTMKAILATSVNKESFNNLENKNVKHG